MAEEEEKQIRVVDRRMFTPDGNLRPEYAAEERSEPPPSRPAEPGPEAERADRLGSSGGETVLSDVGGPGPEPAAQEPQGDFATMVRSLATTAYSALGLVPDPAGGRRRDAVVARQMIDWLAVLEQKTRGNLSFGESDFLSRALYELRMAFVEMTRPTKK